MAITVVQAATLASLSASGAGGGPVSFSSLPTVGNSVIAVMAGWPTSGAVWTGSTCSDNQSGNGYSQLGFVEEQWSLNAICAWLCPVVAGSAGTFTITPKFTPTAGTGNYLMGALEVSGLDPVNYMDQSAEFRTTSANVASVSVLTRDYNKLKDTLVLALLAFDNARTVSDPASSGYTSFGLHQSDATFDCEFSYKILTAIEQSSGTWTYGGGTAAAAALLVTLRGLTPAVPPVSVPGMLPRKRRRGGLQMDLNLSEWF